MRTKITQKHRLFCLPSAGSSASMYRHWDEKLTEVQVTPIEYPGRGARFSAPYAKSIKSLAREVANIIIREMTNEETPNFSLFGHSLGALISWEVCLELDRKQYSLPQSLWVSARKAPHFKPSAERRSDLSDKDLLSLLNNMGGTPAELLASPEFQALMLPIVRADFKLHDNYLYDQEHNSTPRLAIPIIALGGKVDEQVPYDTLREWQQYTTTGFEQFEFSGGHFYLQEPDFLDWLQGKLPLLNN
ncbi:thioesterase II family protein [Marinomonas mediterranea]|uniref:thioesterase II family protein n=1 Tax=Marinomonas mediterranea TaxID=119864 RepID=UPI00234B1485|nr:alpha/beta fold hydrolase [Marinomonas mediterranea]WCN08297.1 alpha/beta fold hydrolase [Marinomonas mediterranea]WCN12355.1 alpha/beta fold hydrolase [Marinomonas mediterranea]